MGYISSRKYRPWKDKELMLSEHLNNKIGCKEIAQKYNINISTLIYWLKKLEIPIRNRSDNIKNKTYRKLTKLNIAVEYKSGESIRQLAEKYGISQITIKNYLKEKGICVRSNGEQLKGRKLPKSVCKKMGKSRRGKLLKTKGTHISPINELIRKRYEAIKWRRAIFERDNYTCICCHHRGGQLHAHHIFGFAKYKEFRFIVTNGITLCLSCHKSIHLGKKRSINQLRML